MTTFSQLVDSMAAEVLRPDLRGLIPTYLNQAIRELHFDPDTNKAILFRSNLVEDQLTANVETGFSWELPTPERWQAMQTVRYDSVWDRDGLHYPPEVIPSRALREMKSFWYQAGYYLFFAGYGGSGATISLAYYLYPRRIKYQAPADRLVTWDDDSGWTYDVTLVTDEDKAEAKNLVTHWLLERWQTVLEESIRAKIYKRASDDGRARTAYSAYMLGRANLVSAEQAMVGGYQ